MSFLDFLLGQLAPLGLFFAIVALGLRVTGWIDPPRRGRRD